MRNLSIILSIVIALLVATATVGFVTTASATVTITVEVVTPSGEPVADANLRASWDGGTYRSTTTANGLAFVDVPKGANVTIVIEHPVYIRNTPFELTNASDREVEIRVYEKATMRLTVIDVEGPVRGVTVEFWNNNTIVATRTTDSQGTIGFVELEADHYEIALRKPGYSSRIVGLDISGDISK